MNLFSLKSFIQLLIIPCIISTISTASSALESKPGTMYIIGRVKTVNLQSGNTVKKYYIIMERSQLKVRITGPAVIRVDFRKNIQPNNPKSKKTIALKIYRENEVYKEVSITPLDSLTDIYLETSAMLPSEPNYFELFIPPGEFVYSFAISGESVGGGALNFTLKEVLIKKPTHTKEERTGDKAKKIATTKERKKHLGISGSIGYIGSGGYLQDPIYYVEMVYFVPFHVQPLMLSLEAGFYSAQSQETKTYDLIGDANLKFNLKVIPVTFNILYSVPLKFPLKPYLGGGVGVYFSTLSYSYDNPPHGSGKLNDNGFGFNIRGGITYEIQPGEIIGEYRLISAKLNATDSVTGEVGGSSFLLGYRFIF